MDEDTSSPGVLQMEDSDESDVDQKGSCESLSEGNYADEEDSQHTQDEVLAKRTRLVKSVTEDEEQQLVPDSDNLSKPVRDLDTPQDSGFTDKLIESERTIIKESQQTNLAHEIHKSNLIGTANELSDISDDENNFSNISEDHPSVETERRSKTIANQEKLVFEINSIEDSKNQGAFKGISSSLIEEDLKSSRDQYFRDTVLRNCSLYIGTGTGVKENFESTSGNANSKHTGTTMAGGDSSVISGNYLGGSEENSNRDTSTGTNMTRPILSNNSLDAIDSKLPLCNGFNGYSTDDSNPKETDDTNVAEKEEPAPLLITNALRFDFVGENGTSSVSSKNSEQESNKALSDGDATEVKGVDLVSEKLAVTEFSSKSIPSTLVVENTNGHNTDNLLSPVSDNIKDDFDKNGRPSLNKTEITPQVEISLSETWKKGSDENLSDKNTSRENESIPNVGENGDINQNKHNFKSLIAESSPELSEKNIEKQEKKLPACSVEITRLPSNLTPSKDSFIVLPRSLLLSLKKLSQSVKRKRNPRTVKTSKMKAKVNNTEDGYSKISRMRKRRMPKRKATVIIPVTTIKKPRNPPHDRSLSAVKGSPKRNLKPRSTTVAQTIEKNIHSEEDSKPTPSFKKKVASSRNKRGSKKGVFAKKGKKTQLVSKEIKESVTSIGSSNKSSKRVVRTSVKEKRQNSSPKSSSSKYADTSSKQKKDSDLLPDRKDNLRKRSVKQTEHFKSDTAESKISTRFSKRLRPQ